MSFKTSRGVRKKRGRWSKKGYVTEHVFSCTNCFRKYENPEKKEDGTMICIHCFMYSNQYHEVKQIKVSKRK